MSAIKPRAAYCTGCDTTFDKMHLMIEHRRLNQCGGRYLPSHMRSRLELLRSKREGFARQQREEVRQANLTPAERISEARRNFLDGR